MEKSRGLGPTVVSVLVLVAASACASQPSATRTGGQRRSASTAPVSPPFSATAPDSRPAAVTSTVPPPPLTAGSTTTIGVPTSSRSGVVGLVLFGPTCPVERIPPDPQCGPRPGAADVRLLRPDGSVAAQSRAGPDGVFEVPAAPGRYGVKATPVADGPGRGCQTAPEQVTVVAGSVVRVAVSCDTGIR